MKLREYTKAEEKEVFVAAVLCLKWTQVTTGNKDTAPQPLVKKQNNCKMENK